MKTAREIIKDAVYAVIISSMHKDDEEIITRALSALKELIKRERPEDREISTTSFTSSYPSEKRARNKALKEYDEVIDEVFK